MKQINKTYRIIKISAIVIIAIAMLVITSIAASAAVVSDVNDVISMQKNKLEDFKIPGLLPQMSDLFHYDAGDPQQFVDDRIVTMSGGTEVVTSRNRFDLSCTPLATMALDNNASSESIVKQTGRMQGDIIYVPEDYPTIQEAINYATDGDEIIVHPGTYYEAINLLGKAIYLHSSGGPEVTIIDATDLNTSVVTCANNEESDTILKGFTITGGVGTLVDDKRYGGGMYNLDSSPTVVDCIFTANETEPSVQWSYGGGMYNNFSNPTVMGCIFIDNIAIGGSGGKGGGMCNDNSYPMVTSCTFSENLADNGGGLYNDSSSPAITNCIFDSNKAESENDEFVGGGGMYNCDSSPTVSNCTFTDNTVSINLYACGGGGMYNCDSSPTVSYCMFVGNTTIGYGAFSGGGGMLNRNSNPTVTECTFDANRGQNGGGMLDYAEPGSSTVVINCVFTNNAAYASGGGIAGHYFDEALVIDCTFTGNTADHHGGGMSIYAGTPTVTNCVFDGNSADRGGGIRIMYSSSNITGCSFIDNFARDYGGGMYNETADKILPLNTFDAGFTNGSRVIQPKFINAMVTNCTFEGNTAPYGGGMCNYMCYGDGPTVINCLFNGNFGLGALYNYECWDILPIINCTFTGNDAWAIANIDHSSPLITNCILWGDESGEILNDLSEPVVAYCNVQGGYEGEGNIDADPLFTDPENSNYHIRPYSPCIDAGNNNVVPEDITTDLDGNPRFFDDLETEDTGYGVPPIVDMGAYEFQVVYVPEDYPTIQEAINAAEDGDEIIVHPGTYYEAINFLGKVIYLHSCEGPEVTIIDGESLNTSVVSCVSGEGPATALEGFTITNGNAEDGGGMYNYGSSPTVMNCTFVGNSAEDGGGMYNYLSEPTITYCTFIANSATDSGGGIYNEILCNLTATNCTFIGNEANRFGGGMFIYYSTPTLRDCTFEGNTAERGGGMCNIYSGPHITGCSFIANSAEDYGGGMYNETFDKGESDSTYGRNMNNDFGVMNNQPINATVTNCVFEGNTAPYGGGMCNFMCFGHGPTVVNCLFKGNFGLGALCNYYCWDALPIINCTFTGNNTWGIANIDDSSPVITNCILWGDGGGEILNNPGEPAVTYCDVQGGYEGEGNIDADPLFVDPDNGNYRISYGSPCIDAGNNEAVPEGITTDFDGNPRFVDDPATEDTGYGVPPIIDMGAYEFQVGDINGDGKVNTEDLLLLLVAWGNTGGPEDINGDGIVNTEDLLILLANWTG